MIRSSLLDGLIEEKKKKPEKLQAQSVGLASIIKQKQTEKRVLQFLKTEVPPEAQYGPSAEYQAPTPYDPAEPPIPGERFVAGAVERGAAAALRATGLLKLLPVEEAGLAGGAAVPSPEELAKMPWYRKIPEYAGWAGMETNKLGAMYGVLSGVGLIGRLPPHPTVIEKAIETAKWFGGTEAIEQLFKAIGETVDPEQFDYEPQNIPSSALIGAGLSLGLSGAAALGRKLFMPTEKALALRVLRLKRGAKEPEIRRAMKNLGQRVRSGELTSKDQKLITKLYQKWFARQPDIVYRMAKPPTAKLAVRRPVKAPSVAPKAITPEKPTRIAPQIEEYWGKGHLITPTGQLGPKIVTKGIKAKPAIRSKELFTRIFDAVQKGRIKEGTFRNLRNRIDNAIVAERLKSRMIGRLTKEQQQQISEAPTFEQVEKQIDAAIKPTEAAPAVEKVAKEPWEMTAKELVELKKTGELEKRIQPWEIKTSVAIEAQKILGGKVETARLGQERIIKKAVREGKPVPREVLEEYKSEKWAQEALAKAAEEPSGGPDPLQQIRLALERAKKTRPEVVLEQKAMRKKRVGAAVGALKRAVEKGRPAEKAIFESTGLLKGPLTEYEGRYQSIRDIVKPEAVDAGFSAISNNPNLQYFEKVNTAVGFRKLVDGDYLTNTDARLIQKQFGPEWGKLARKRIPIGKKILRTITQIANIPITSLVSGDISGILRQARPLGQAHPILYGQMAKKAHQAFFSEKSAQQLIEDYKNDPFYEEAKEIAKLEISEMGEAAAELIEAEERFIAAPLLEQVPGIKYIIRASERAFVAPLNWLRMTVYSNMRTAADASGKKLSAKELRHIASTINDLSGRSSIKRTRAARVLAPLMSAFFSPRFSLSRIKLPYTIGAPMARSLMTGKIDPSLGLAASGFAGLIVTGLLVMFLIKLAGGNDVEIEPDLRSSDGGKVRIGNKRIDLWSGYLQPAQLFVRLATGQRKSQSGRLYNINRTDLIETFARSKAAPLVGLIIDAWRGKTFYGQKLGAPPRGKAGEILTKRGIPERLQGIGKETWNRLTPLVVQDAVDALVDSGVPWAVLMGTLAFYGTSVQTYPKWPSAQLQDVRDKIAQKKFNKKWDQLKFSQQRTLKTMKKIKAAEFQSKQERRKMGPAEISKYFLRPVQESAQRITKAMPKDIQTELEWLAMTTGGCNRRIAGNFYLNDKRLDRYEQLAIENTKKALNSLITKRKELWDQTDNIDKVKQIQKQVNKARAEARKILLAEIERGQI